MTPQGPGQQEPTDQAIQHEDPIDRPVARQTFIQLIVSDAEKQRLHQQIYNDFLGARSDHDSRIQRFRRYYRMWRGLNQTPGNKDDGEDLQVPLMKWSVFGQWAKTMQALLGEDAEVIAKPTSPVDEADSLKSGHYMTWRVFEYMCATVGLATFAFRTILFGRAHAECIYEQEYYWQRDTEDIVAKYAEQFRSMVMKQDPAFAGDHFDVLTAANIGWAHVRDDVYDYEVLAYDGPRIYPLWPSQFIVPSQDNVEKVDQFEWKIRRDRVTPQQLLDGEKRGKYQDVERNWTEIVGAAQNRQERNYWLDDERIDADIAEGVDHTNILGHRDSLEIWRWYGKWRFPKGKRDVRPNNLRYRERDQREVMVSYLPELQLVVGIQDLRDVYPRMRKRDPFLDMSTTKDGSYWSPGMGELLEDLQNELTVNHALFRKAGFLSVGPIILFNPAGGWDPDVFEYEPGMAVPVQDPSSVKVVSFAGNLEGSEKFSQVIKGFAELVTGVNDQSLGKSADQPNAPRTASGQAMLLNEGNVRAALDMTFFREDFSNCLGYIWALDKEYADEKVFFRVTGDDAPGYDVDKGFGTMTAQDRERPMAFDMKFATSVWSKEAKKQYMLQLYGLSLQNPVVQTNPRALWVLLNRVWEAFGEHNFKDIIPEPASPETPKMPTQEWSEMLKGDIVHVNPLDDDQQHILDHRRRLEAEINEPPERQSNDLQSLAKAHIMEHEQQFRQKQLLQHLAMQLFQQAQAQQQGQQPGAFAPPQPPGGAAGPTPPAPGAPPPGAAPAQPAAPPPQQTQ